MMNKKCCTYSSKMKVFLILPVLVVILLLFQAPSSAIESTFIDIDPQFKAPLTKGKITNNYGMSVDPFTEKAAFHNGLDIAVQQGTPIQSAAGGVVVIADSVKGYGYRIVIEHSADYSTHYYHLYKILVKPEQQVKEGELIGQVGSSGLSTAPHLHFEIRKEGNAQNPVEHIDISIFKKK